MERKLKSFHFLRVVWTVRVNQWRNGPMKIISKSPKWNPNFITVTGSNFYRLLKALATLFGKFCCLFFRYFVLMSPFTGTIRIDVAVFTNNKSIWRGIISVASCQHQRLNKFYYQFSVIQFLVSPVLVTQRKEKPYRFGCGSCPLKVKPREVPIDLLVMGLQWKKLRTV